MKERTKTYIYVALDIVSHVVLSIALAVVFYKMTGGWLWPVLAIIGGVLIDLDHFFDYFLYYGLKVDIPGFFAHGYVKSGKAYSLFHSWELVAILWVAGIFYSFCIPLAAGMTLHMATDFIYSYTKQPWRMFFVYRVKHNFELDRMDPEGHKKMKQQLKN